MRVFKKVREKYGMEMKLFVAMFLFLFAVFFAMNRVYTKTIHETTTSINTYIFQKVSAAVKETLSEVNQQYLSIAYNKNLKTFFDRATKNPFRESATYALLDDFKNYERYSVRVDLCFLYLRETDAVLSYNGVLDSKRFFQMYFDDERMSYEEWKDILLTQNTSAYTDMYYRDETGKVQESSAFLFPVHEYEKLGIGVILSSKEHLLAGVQDLQWDAKCDVFVYDTFGNIMVSAQRLNSGVLPVSLDEIQQYNDKDHAVSVSEISVGDEKRYVATIVPKNVLGDRMFWISILIASIIFICAIALWYFARLLVKLHQKPAKQLSHLLDSDDSEIKYDELYQRVGELVERNKRLLKDSERHEEKLNVVTIYQLLRGIMSEQELLEKGITFAHSQFAVLLFDIDNIDSLFAEDFSMKGFERRYHLASIIENIFKELFEKNDMSFYLAEYENFSTSLINVAENVDVSKIRKVAETGVECINHYFGIRLSYALSSVVPDVESVSSAYDQALYTLSYKHVVKSDESLFYNDVSSVSEERYIFNLYMERMLVQLVCAGNQIATQEMLEKLFALLRKNRYSLNYIRYVILDIASTITKCADEVLGEKSDSGVEDDLYKTIHSDKDIDTIQTAVVQYASSVCRAVLSDTQEKQKVNKPKEHFERIIEYVNQNFKDEDMNVTLIADRFGLSPQYLIRIFKDYTNTSLLDYINGLRVNYAMELKHKGGYTVKEISKMAGFNNERTYYRVLKKYDLK